MDEIWNLSMRTDAKHNEQYAHFLYKYEGKGVRGLSPKSNPWEILSNLTEMEAIATM